MTGEGKAWTTQAEDDFKNARLLCENHRYGATVFFYQQAIEKITKGYLVSKKKTPVKTHRIEDLLKEAKLDITELNLEIKVEELSKSYIRVRYPDLNKQYFRTRGKVEPLVEMAEKLYLWIKKQLKNS